MDPESSRPTSAWTLATLALSMLLAALGTSIANIALPTLASQFHAPFEEVRWVVVSYLAAMTVAAVVAGRLGDRFGLKRTLLAGLGLFAAASIACGLASDLRFLVGARALQGAGAAFLMTLTISLVREAFGAERLGSAMGLLGTMSAIGTALGPTLGGLLISATGWSGVFFALAPVALLAGAMVLRFLPSGEAAAGKVAVGPSIFREYSMLAGLAANLLVASVMMATLVVGPFLLQTSLGLGAAQAGLVMSAGPAISIAGGVVSGKAADAWGSRAMLAVGLVLMAVGAIAFGFLPVLLGLPGYLMAVVILTPGYQLFQAANNTGIMANAPRQSRGVISGVLNLSRNLGLVLGAWGMGALFAFGAGAPDLDVANPDQIGHGLAITFGLAGAMMAFSFLITSGPWRTNPSAPKDAEAG